MAEAETCGSGDYCPHQEQADRIAAAPFVLLAAQDGNATFSVQDGVDDVSLAAYLRHLADMVERGEHRNGCTDPACTEHDH